MNADEGNKDAEYKVGGDEELVECASSSGEKDVKQHGHDNAKDV